MSEIRILGLSVLLAASALPLPAGGLEVAAGVAIGPTDRGPALGDRKDNTTGLQLRVGWDRSPSRWKMDQLQVMGQAGCNEFLQYSMAGAGWQRSWWTEHHGAQAALGAELRAERYRGHSSLAAGPSPLAGDQAWMVRPWLRAQAGFRGILIPLPEAAGSLLAWLTQGGTITHPFTRLEVAVPLWRRGGEGPSGTLRQMAPRWEASLQLGMRFGWRNP